MADYSPQWGKGPGHLHWTRPRVIAALAHFVAEQPPGHGPLPQNNRAYAIAKKTAPDGSSLPSPQAIKRWFPTFAHGWLAAGADPEDVPRRTWSGEQIETLIKGRMAGVPLVVLAEPIGKSPNVLSQMIRVLKKSGMLCARCGVVPQPGPASTPPWHCASCQETRDGESG